MRRGHDAWLRMAAETLRTDFRRDESRLYDKDAQTARGWKPRAVLFFFRWLRINERINC